MKNASLLRPLIVQGLLETDIPKNISDFKSWISSGQYIIRSVPSKKEIQIEINNDYAFSHMLAYDSCRTATASFESMQSIHSINGLPKSYSWIAITCYYAAFFSAHAIMRCFGYTCSQLERGHIQILHDYSSAIGISNSLKLEKGYFCGKHDASCRIFTLRKMVNTHEDTWFWFTKCLESMSKDVLGVSGVTSKKQALSAEIDDLIIGLKNNGHSVKGNYLSQFRNAVNYRQEYDSWHPYGKGSIQAEQILSLVRNWKNESIPLVGGWKKSKDVYNYFFTCAAIVNLCHSLIQVIIDNSESNNNLYKRWPNKFLLLTSAL